MARICSTIIGIFCVASLLSAAELTDAKFAELHQSIRPQANELWQTIPWKISLIDAQHAAAKADKPIFIWAMDGHPLGCT